MTGLLDLVGTRGTQAPKAWVPPRDRKNISRDQKLAETGTLGTHGTRKNGHPARCDVCQRVAVSPSGLDAAALLDAYAERLAICVADGIPEAEAIATAEAEIGAEVMRRLLAGDRPCA